MNKLIKEFEFVFWTFFKVKRGKLYKLFANFITSIHSGIRFLNVFITIRKFQRTRSKKEIEFFRLKKRKIEKEKTRLKGEENLNEIDRNAAVYHCAGINIRNFSPRSSITSWALDRGHCGEIYERESSQILINSLPATTSFPSMEIQQKPSNKILPIN